MIWDQMSAAERQPWVQRIFRIYDAWDRHEDLDELRSLLGVGTQSPKGGRRRKRRTVAKEYGIACTVFGCMKLGGNEPEAVALAAERYSVDIATARRYHAAWSERLEALYQKGDILVEQPTKT